MTDDNKALDEVLPPVPPDAQIPGSAGWWKEHMRSHLSGLFELNGNSRPNAAANRVIRSLERLIPPNNDNTTTE